MTETDDLADLLVQATGPRPLDPALVDRLVGALHAQASGQGAPERPGRRRLVWSAAAGVVTVLAVSATALSLHARPASRTAALDAPAHASAAPKHLAPPQSLRPAPVVLPGHASSGLGGTAAARGTTSSGPAVRVRGDGEVDQVDGVLVGPLAGGGRLVLHGQGLDGASSVTFGPVVAPFTVVDAQTLAVTVPPADHPATVLVTVLDSSNRPVDEPGGQTAFTYLPAPTVTGLSAAQGLPDGGGWITVDGTGFTDVSAVRFGDVAATGVRVLSDGELQAQVPKGSGAVDVTVVTPGGVSATSSSDRYTYL